MLTRITNDATKAQSKLDLEYKHASLEEFRIPPQAAVGESIKMGDWWLEDTSEAYSDRGGTILQVVADDWSKPKTLYIRQVWGPSTKHPQILIDLCKYIISQGLGNTPVEYGRSGHPLTLIADQYAVDLATEEQKGGWVRTTAAKALARLLKNFPELK